MRTAPYISAEDSALLRGVMRRYSGKRCLEIGAGNAGGMMILKERFREVVGTDLAGPAMGDWRGTRASYVLADRASPFRDGVFDLVAFNPPYLESEDVADGTTDGGPGLRTALGFLREALRVVREDGKILMLLNGDADIGQFASLSMGAGFSMKKVASTSLFFEELSVWEIMQTTNMVLR